MARLYAIREKDSGSFCSSSGGMKFTHDLQQAAFFKSKSNADKAMKSMVNRAALWPTGQHQYSIWYEGDQECHPNLQAYIGQYLGFHGLTEADIRAKIIEKTCQPEVVEIRLTVV